MIITSHSGRSPGDWAYYPVEDSIPLRTWRSLFRDDLIRRMRAYQYPTAGCHGGRLERACPRCKGRKAEPAKPGEFECTWCTACNGAGVVVCDAPDRKDIP